MSFRKMLLVAFVATPLALAPASVSAQDRTAEASARSQAAKRDKAMPRGMAVRPADLPVPPGINLTRPPQAPTPPATEPPTGGDDTVCETEVVFVNGVLMIRDCNGNLFDPLNPTGT